MLDYYFPDCEVCGRPGCGRGCLCNMCGDGPGCHLEGCPGEPGISEEEMDERLMKSPYIEVFVRELQRDVENLYEELERVRKELANKQ